MTKWANIRNKILTIFGTPNSRPYYEYSSGKYLYYTGSISVDGDSENWIISGDPVNVQKYSHFLYFFILEIF